MDRQIDRGGQTMCVRCGSLSSRSLSLRPFCVHTLLPCLSDSLPVCLPGCGVIACMSCVPIDLPINAIYLGSDLPASDTRTVQTDRQRFKQAWCGGGRCLSCARHTRHTPSYLPSSVSIYRQTDRQTDRLTGLSQRAAGLGGCSLSRTRVGSRQPLT